MNIIVTRPEEDAVPLREKLEAMGHRVLLLPLLRIVPHRQVTIRELPYQAVIVTSANALRHLAGHSKLKSIRVLTVGPQSLQAAKHAGFERAEAHGGDLDGLAEYIGKAIRPADGPLLYLSGNETAGDLKGRLTELGFDCRRTIVYDVVQATDPGTIKTVLHNSTADAVLLYSPRSARIWCNLIEEGKLTEKAAAIHYFCLSRNVATILPMAWPRSVAASPDEASMLALLEPASGTR